MSRTILEQAQVIWYLRLSLADDDGKDESNSITSQRKCIADYCKKHIPNDNIVECVDDGYSGTNFERPGFRKMMFLVKNGNVKTIVLKDLSRLGRNYLEVGYYLEYVFPSYGVRVVAINDNFDSEALSGGTVGLEVAIRNLMNEYYSRDISKKISSAVHIKKMKGEYVYGAVPFGYRKGTVKNTIVIDPEAASIVKYVFSLALSGISYSAIAKMLNEEKVITPSVYLAKYGGRQNYKTSAFWSYESVRNLLTNRIYTGDTEIYKSHVKTVGTNKVKQLPVSERVVIENTHEAIISYEDFIRARDVVKITKPKTPSKGKTGMLNGYLVCGCCGGKLTKGKAKNHYFLCVNARYRPDSACGQVRAEEKKMQEILLNAVRAQLDLFEEQDAKIRQSIARKGSEILTLQKELTDLSMQEKRSMERKMRLYEDFVEGKIQKDVYLQEKDLLAKELDGIKAKSSILSANIAELSNMQQKSSDESKESRLLSGFKGQELSEDMLSAFVQKVVVMPDGEIEIFWKYKDEFTNELQ